MAKPRLKIVRTILRDRTSMERLVRETVALQIQREGAIAARDAELAALGSRHNPAIDTCGIHIDENLALLEQWSDGNPGEFGAARSIRIEGHRMGYRLGNPKAEPLGQLTWKAIATTLKRWASGADERLAGLAAKYLRVKTEADREAMLESFRREREGGLAELDEIGVQITQSETFFLEPDRAGPPEVRLIAGAKPGPGEARSGGRNEAREAA